MDGSDAPLSPDAVIEALTMLAADCDARKFPLASVFYPHDKAVEILQRCLGDIPAEAPGIVARILSHADDIGRPRPSSLAGLGMICGEPWASRMADKARAALDASPLARAELDAMLMMPKEDALIVAHAIADWMAPRSDAELRPRGSLTLSPLLIGTAFCREALVSASARLEAIHQGEVAFQADKAFTVDEARVLGRIFAVGLDRDDGKILSHLRQIWILAAVAPGSANTMPSQSIALRLARAVEEQPSPDAVTIMRDVSAAVRHEGVKKKLGRMLANAERRLTQQPDLLARLPPGVPIPKTMLPAVRRSFEQLYRTSAPLPAAQWQERFMMQKELRALSERLIWRVMNDDGSTFSARPRIVKGEPAWHLVDAGLLPTRRGQSVVLWHPLTAPPDERNRWRDHVIAERLDQPFMQAFRQYYRPSEDEMDGSRTALFAGHHIAIGPFLGVAGREGWWIERYGGLALSCGRLRFRYWSERNFYPGMTGDTKTSILEAEQPASSEAGNDTVRLQDIDPVLFSEVLRSVDLITSAGALIYDPVVSAEHLGSRKTMAGDQSARMRREVLRRLYRGHTAIGGFWVEARHVRVGEYAIHIATGRVTRHGDPVDPEAPGTPASIVWMRYPDEVLALIIRTVTWLEGRS